MADQKPSTGLQVTTLNSKYIKTKIIKKIQDDHALPKPTPTKIPAFPYGFFSPPAAAAMPMPAFNYWASFSFTAPNSTPSSGTVPPPWMAMPVPRMNSAFRVPMPKMV